MECHVCRVAVTYAKWTKEVTTITERDAAWIKRTNYGQDRGEACP